MSIETAITKAWQRQAIWLWLLLPLSWLYGLLTLLRRQLYSLNLLSSYRAPMPIMVIGNITVGGSGKTPLIISLVNYLQQQGIEVGVISRGYGGDSRQMPALVTAASLSHVVGDEPCLIVSTTGVPMAVCPNRQQAITTLIAAYPKLQLIIADDGLQHYAMQRDLEWIVVDAERGFGNRQLLPVGFLREPIARLKNSTVVYHQRISALSDTSDKSTDQNKLTMHLKPDGLKRLVDDNAVNDLKLTDNLRVLIKQQATIKGMVYAVSGIGYPQRFFRTLRTLGFAVVEQPYPDHYDFALTDLLRYNDHPIIITSKDAIKIKPLVLKAILEQPANMDYLALIVRLWVLPVTAELSATCYRRLDCQLHQLGIDINRQTTSI